MPPQWTGTLVVHAHGGPELGDPKADRVAADLARWSVWTRAGYAYAGTGFHQGGVAVRSAAEDIERVRQLFVSQIGAPTRTILHGQSWGASVAARAAERTAGVGGTPLPFDAVLLTNGVLGGGSQSYDVRFDLRVVYQAICHNHPRADEPPYPLWQGLPLSSTLTRAQLAHRVDECTGARTPAAERSVQQQRNLQDILGVIAIPEHALISHLNWGTWHFQDIVFRRLGGRNPFGNATVRYTGSHDDAALNAAVFRAAPDPSALTGIDRAHILDQSPGSGDLPLGFVASGPNSSPDGGDVPVARLATPSVDTRHHRRGAEPNPGIRGLSGACRQPILRW